MRSIISTLTFVAGALPLVSGHYVFNQLIVNGEVTGQYEYVRKNTNGYQPTMGAGILADDFRCNTGSFASAANTKTYQVAAGTEIGFKLGYGATIQHPGPLQVYMSRAPGDVTAYDGSGDWFKIHEEKVCGDASDGLVNSDWCTWGKDTVTFNVPDETPAGQYLVRVEHIGLHRAMNAHAEFFFTCGQIEVTGSGVDSPSPVVKIPGVYQTDDAAINFNIYYPTPTAYPYTVGPNVWSGYGTAAAADVNQSIGVNVNFASAPLTTFSTAVQANPTAKAHMEVASCQSDY